MVSSSLAAPCGKLPLVIKTCPCCGAGIRPARGWTWINPRPLAASVKCKYLPSVEVVGKEKSCLCVLDENRCPERAGLLWIGEKFYPYPEVFIRETLTQGVSRRVAAIPRDFVAGETWVFLAHRKGRALDYGADRSELDDRSEPWEPAIVAVFKPLLEYVVNENDTEEKLEAIEKRGIQLVQVHRLEEKLDLSANE